MKRARAIRNGLMIALLAANPTRRKNFASLEIGKTFRKIEGQWWICISARATKTKQRPEERPDSRLAHPLHRAISRRRSADPSQPFNEGNEQALGVVWWPYIRARCWQTDNPGHSGDPWHSDFAALVSDRWAPRLPLTPKATCRTSRAPCWATSIRELRTNTTSGIQVSMSRKTTHNSS